MNDDEPRNRHTLSCPIWQSDDPADDCNCGAHDHRFLGDFVAGTNALVDLIESYGPREKAS